MLTATWHRIKYQKGGKWMQTARRAVPTTLQRACTAQLLEYYSVPSYIRLCLWEKDKLRVIAPVHSFGSHNFKFPW